VSGKKIAIMGRPFKKDTNDTRESVAIYVADYLLNEQAQITVYDPKVTAEQIYSDLNYFGTRSDEENRRLLKVVTDPKIAVEKAHATAVLTEWVEFTEFNWKTIYDSMLQPVFLFDGRMLLDHEELKSIGFEVYTIGRG
jgi:UDPglucose 6-dehydrogenase